MHCLYFARVLGDIIEIAPPVAIDEVREEIEKADVCVALSNAKEGWTAIRKRMEKKA